MLASASSSHILSSSYDEILDYFRLNADIDDRIRFLQEKVYSMGTYHEFGPKDERMGFVGRDEYLYIWTGGTYTNHTAAHAYTWREAVSLISDKLLEKDSFEPSLFDFSFEQNPNDTLPSVSEALNASLATVSVHDTRQNYRMPAETVPLGGPKSRFQHNLAAIRLLKTIELENRFATPEEQEILAKYVGWGGLSDAFDPNKENWESEYHALKTLLTEEEYNATRESTLTSFYTPPEVVDAIYSVLSSLGFTQGNVLDPGCGIGVFSGRLPDAMHKSHIYGIEKDSLSARIARQLYQTHTIAIEGYETSSFPDNFFDVAVGNVPFGNFKVHDHRYDQLNLPIHDYFFAKTIDKLRPRGVIAFITSAGTLDKQNTSFRRYLSQRADLLGAIRLPNTVFKANAGTEVTSDIIFLQKRELPRIDDAEWTELDTRYNPDTDTFEPEINSYFVNHPEMVLGEMRTVSGPHGQEQVCIAREGENLKSALAQACQHIQGQITQPENGLYDQESGEKQERLPAAPDVRNYSFALVNDRVYFREDSEMLPVSLNKTAEARVRGMIRLRDDVRQLIDAQLMDQDDHIISQLQKTLNTDYDAFTAKYGLLNSRGNALAFSDDSSYYLLCSLEHVNDKGEFLGKADMFFKRTIGAQKPILHVDTAQEALTISMGERGCIDFDFMSKLSALSKQQLLSQLQGQIYEDPAFPGHYEIAALYLSGNVRKKLEIARAAEAASPGAWTMNIKALEEVQPKDLGPGDITARLGSTWISKEDITQFMYDLFETSAWHRTNQRVRAEYSPVTNTWNIRNADWDRTNAKATSTYGTQRISGYALLQNALNLKDTKLYDTIDGKQILNQNDTLEAQEKQQLICDAFKEWLWSDPVRAARICREYNDRFNAYVAPTFDGSFLRFHNMNPSITLRPWQKNAIARILLSGNTLLDHAVGAGKTWTMVAAAMEGKALGLCNKSMIVVPNHLVGQWASAIYDLYPNAKVLASTKKDFERKNRKKFCSRIATGDYDIIVIGHSQFERIPLSQERQASGIQSEIDHIIAAIADAKEDESQHFTIKQLERTKRNLEVRLQKLHNSKKRDDVISFEELGVDRLFIDESHNYKNLFLYTKMSNIAGISQTDSQRASDLFLKCRYMDELTGNKGNIHATGTVLSNTMSELYAAQRYLSFDLLQDMDLGTFDQWASTFGETITSVELAPEGTGFRARTRFAKFFNIPELMRLYCQVADIQTKEMLDLPLPNPHYEVVPIPASDIQKEYVQTFAERAKKIRGGGVAPNEDNMLCITNDGRKLALDQRLMDASLPDEPLSKINACVDKAFQFWSQYKDQRLTQLIFCDISVPKPGVFNVYDDIKSKLVTKGIPEEEIRFVQEATTDAQKEALFEKVRKGEVRILLGSTGKLGTGTNVQDLLIANHDLDCPYRPSDLEQRAGRGLRQGNTNDDMFIIRYVTENTFDAYMYQLLEIKQRFISQIHNPNPSVREAVDLDEISMSYAEIKALASGDPRIKERVELEADVQRLSMLASRHDNAQYQLQHRLYHDIPAEISSCEQALKKLRMDQKQIKAHPRRTDDGRYLPVTIKNIPYEKASDIGDAILLAAKQVKEGERIPIAAYGGFTLFIDKTTKGWNGLPLTTLELSGAGKYNFLLSNSNVGIVRRLNSILDKDIPDQISANERKIDRLKTEKKSISQELGKPFPRKGELSSKKARLEQLTHDLDLDTQEEATKTASISETISPDRQSSHLDALIHSAISRQAEQVCRTNPSISVPLHEHL